MRLSVVTNDSCLVGGFFYFFLLCKREFILMHVLSPFFFLR